MSNPLNVLVFGCRGQVGSSLVEIMSSAEPCTGNQSAGGNARTMFNVTGVEIEHLDLTDTGAISAFVESHNPHWVINGSAHTAVDLAESQLELSRALNRDAPAAMAAACARIGARFVHYSTDYVFDGSQTRPYVESDSVCPKSVYGITKAEGERAVLEALDNALILRTAWVYSRDGKNFVNTMLSLAGQRDEINVVDDQLGSPTLAHDLAQTTVDLICSVVAGTRAYHGGIFHATGQGEVSWYGFCKEVFALRGIEHVRVNPISTEQYPTPAPRPAYSVLSNERLASVYGLELPAWQDSLRQCLKP